MAKWTRESEVSSFESEQDADRRLHWLAMGTHPLCDPPNPQVEAEFQVVAAELARLRDLGIPPSEIVPQLEEFMSNLGVERGIRLADHLDAATPPPGQPRPESSRTPQPRSKVLPASAPHSDLETR